jgi:hypothetical protein
MDGALYYFHGLMLARCAMVAAVADFSAWLADANVTEDNLTDAQCVVLRAAWAFLQRCGQDYYSVRLLSHFLLHCQLGLPVAHIARLLHLSRSAASAQQNLSSKEVVQAAHHRLSGRSHGKLLPRFAGPVAQFLHEHPEATRWDLLDFLRDHCGVSVSRMALHNFLKKYGLDGPGTVVTFPMASPAGSEQAPEPPTPPATPTVQGSAATPAEPVLAQPTASLPADQPLPVPPAAFFLPPPDLPAPS